MDENSQVPAAEAVRRLIASSEDLRKRTQKLIVQGRELIQSCERLQNQARAAAEIADPADS
ncbi:MAG TPA: hypothetical protein VG897_03140 [Terriglobales bacterium]|nr:hypothetical protein [Terriglobales bacterium]